MGKEVDDKNANGRMVKRGMAGGESTASRYPFLHKWGFFLGGNGSHVFPQTWIGRREPLD